MTPEERLQITLDDLQANLDGLADALTELQEARRNYERQFARVTELENARNELERQITAQR